MKASLICPKCGGEGRPLSTDTSRYCRKCRNEHSRLQAERDRRDRPFYVTSKHKNSKNKKDGIEGRVSEAYLHSIWTGVCPVFNTEIQIAVGVNHPLAANLDRIDPSKGYVEGNVVWLSSRANRLKNNATVEELQALLKWMKGVGL